MSTSSADRLAGVSSSLAIKAPADYTTTANITLSGLAVQAGGTWVSTLTQDDANPTRILVKNQTNAIDNGLWNPGAGTWTRCKDFDGARDVVRGTVVHVYQFDGDLWFEVSTANPIVIGTSAINFVASTAASVLARLASTASAADGDALLGVKDEETGAVATTQHEVNARVKSIFTWLTDDLKDLVRARTGYNTTTRGTLLTALTTAFAEAIAGQFDLHFPAGLYEIEAANFPWRNTEFPTVSLLECNNISLICEGPDTVFKTVSVNGADVFQLNGLKNFHVKGFPTLQATASGSAAGSNGCSVTNGFDNLTLEICAKDLASKPKADYIDGGKALSIQPDTTASECGTLTAIVYADGCAEGFGCDMDPDTMEDKRTSIRVDLVAQNCFMAVKYSASEATGALSATSTTGIVVRAQSINCQRDVQLSRARGIDVEVQIITTKTAAARRLAPDGGTWLAADTVVDALSCNYVHNGRISVTGNKGACDYKVQIGGGSDPSSGLSAKTNDSTFYLDIAGTAATANFNLISAGGDTMSNCLIYSSLLTLSSYPAGAYTESLANTLIIGPTQRLVNPIVSGSLNLSEANVVTSYSSLSVDAQAMWAKQTFSSANTKQVFGVKDHTGAKVLAIRNDGIMCSDGRIAATAVGGGVINVVPWYSAANALIGYVPVYATYTP